jgi:hypothetical protein
LIVTQGTDVKNANYYQIKEIIHMPNFGKFWFENHCYVSKSTFVLMVTNKSVCLEGMGRSEGCKLKQIWKEQHYLTAAGLFFVNNWCLALVLDCN